MSHPPEPQRPHEQRPPDERPSLLTRAGNFIRSIPGWIHSAIDWAKYQWNNLKRFLKIKGHNTYTAGVDLRLLHIASVIGGSIRGGNITCTDGMRPEHVRYPGSAKNSEHLRGNALDLSLRGVPGQNNEEKKCFVAAVATVLGYDGVCVVAHKGTAYHLHVQNGLHNIARLHPARSSNNSPAKLAAAQRFVQKLVGREGLERIMQTRTPYEIARNTQKSRDYPPYVQPYPHKYRLVYSTEPKAPPTKPHTNEAKLRQRQPPHPKPRSNA